MNAWGRFGPAVTCQDRDAKSRCFRRRPGVRGTPLSETPGAQPNLNAFAERWVRSVKEECISKLIPFGENSLHRALAEFTAHFHSDRNHPGKGNIVLFLFQKRDESRCPLRRTPRRPASILVPCGLILCPYGDQARRTMGELEVWQWRY
jgi:hypothetical protein